VLVLVVAFLNFACAATQERRGIPPEVESTIGTINDEIAAERYDKIYTDASALWRQDATLDQSTATFKMLRAKLGTVENRTLQSAVEQQNSGGPLKGRSYIVTYRTKFQNGEGMETFTLVEKDGRWLLARYFVNSTALK
jgi:mRNA-degrading endonuclease toxin of MazEF toxin-antitoxin module